MGTVTLIEVPKKLWGREGEISGVAEKLLASYEGIYSMELVMEMSTISIIRT